MDAVTVAIVSSVVSGLAGAVVGAGISSRSTSRLAIRAERQQLVNEMYPLICIVPPLLEKIQGVSREWMAMPDYYTTRHLEGLFYELGPLWKLPSFAIVNRARIVSLLRQDTAAAIFAYVELVRKADDELGASYDTNGALFAHTSSLHPDNTGWVAYGSRPAIRAAESISAMLLAEARRR